MQETGSPERKKNRSPDCKNLDGNNTKINKTEKNHTDKSKGYTSALEEKFSLYGRFKNVVLSEAELREFDDAFSMGLPETN